MAKTKARWDEIAQKVQNNVDYMDTNHWFFLNNAIEEISPGVTETDYEKAFDALRKNVLENYVHVDDGKDPALDPFEVTYHLLVYFETEQDKEVSFKKYLLNTQTEIRRKTEDKQDSEVKGEFDFESEVEGVMNHIKSLLDLNKKRTPHRKKADTLLSVLRHEHAIADYQTTQDELHESYAREAIQKMKDVPANTFEAAVIDISRLLELVEAQGVDENKLEEARMVELEYMVSQKDN